MMPYQYHKEFEHLEIPSVVIRSATNDFKTIIGGGGSGRVYRGDIFLSGKIIPIAVKRLGVTLSGKGHEELLTELQLLSSCRHPNIVSLVGFTNEGHDKLIVYEYAEGRSLDNYLYKACPLTWRQRVKICINVARGLDFCHNHLDKDHRIIHRDIKSANILLDKNMKAMIGDFGLSLKGRANESETSRKISGTPGYCDPAYIKTGIITYKSDVYSFGVVLLEALCGRLAFKNVIGEQQYLVPLARRCYEQGKLNEIMDLDLKDSESIKVFSEIAYQCLHNDPEKRPSMDLVLQKLEKALELHVVLTFLPLQAFKIQNNQQWLNQLPSRGSMRTGQRSSIYQLQKGNTGHGLAQMDGFVNNVETIPSFIDLKYPGISINQDGSRFDINQQLPFFIDLNYRGISINQDGSRIDINEQLPSFIDLNYRGISNNQDGDIRPEYDVGDQPLTLGDAARPQPSQTRGWLPNINENDEN